MMLKTGMGSVTPGAADALQAASIRYGVSLDLLTAIATQESGLNQGARSSAGAIGVMQLMPGTAAQYGADPYDLQQNVDAGAHYFSDMLRRYNGDTSLALAAYNAGPGNVDRYGGIPPFTETQNYVASVLGMIGSDGGDGIDVWDGSGSTSSNTLAYAGMAAIGLAAALMFSGGRG